MERSNQSKATGDTAWKTSVTSIEPNRILIRGYPLDEMMGRCNFSESVYLLLTGELPSLSLGRLIDAMLVSFIDHGVTPPSTLAARNAATTGASLRGSVAAGVLGFGPHHGADLLACRQLLDDGLAVARTGKSITQAASDLVAKMVEGQDGRTLPPPGFGHRYHTKDPRAIRLLQMAHELEVDHEYCQLLRAIEHALVNHPETRERSLPINVDGAVAAVCGDIGLPPEVADALLVISRVPGLAAHALEEQQREEPMRMINPASHVYDGPSERRLSERRK